jgi:hypothetical protein
MSRSPLTERYLEKYGKTLMGRTDMKDALKKLDKLTQEEARMVVAQNLKVAHAVDEGVRGVANTVAVIDNRVADVNDRVAGVEIESPVWMIESLASMSEWPGLRTS